MAKLPEFRYFVEPAWIDRLGHLTAARYVAIFDECSERLLDLYGLGLDYTGMTDCGLFTIDLHTKFLREVRQGDPIRVSARILALDDKRLLTYYEMHQSREEYLAATFEQLAIHVGLKTRKAAAFLPAARRALEDAMQEHGEVPLPSGVGASIVLQGKLNAGA